MGKMSREKGKRGERYIASLFQAWGYDVRRSVQYNGKAGDADLIGIDGIHPEVKFVEKLSLSKAMKQACTDAKDGRKPTVFHKKNREPVMVTMLFDDWMDMYKEWEAGREER